VPADATAVSVNVTVTEPSNNGFLTVYPAGEGTPNSSNLNFLAGETVANLAIVPVGAGGQIAIYNAIGTVQVVVDLQGYFEPNSGSSTAGSYVALTPARITDTRSGSGEPNSGSTLTQGGVLNMQVAGEGGVPATGVAAVALNVTITDTGTYSYVSAYPTGISHPLSSTINWTPGETLANRSVVQLGTNGEVSFYNYFGTADLVVDVVGYFTDGTTAPDNESLYYPISPVRVLDTRGDAGTLTGGNLTTIQFAGVDGISPTADAAVTNLTATDASSPGFLTESPGAGTTTTSDVNFLAGGTVPNLTIVTLNGSGFSYFHNSIGTTDAVIDVFGYFQAEATVSPAAAPPPCTGAGLAANVTTSTQGTPVQVTASATCSSGFTPEYEYFYQPIYSSVWVLGQNWSTSNTYGYPTNNWLPGPYNLAVWVSTQGAFQSVFATSSLTSDATVRVANIVYSPQIYSMTCEEAALQMALSHEGIYISQQQVLNTEGVNASVPGVGPAYTRADPMVNFVGPPNGAEASGYEPGAYYSAIARAADGLGGNVMAAGEGISPNQVYEYVAEGHPVEVWVTFDFRVRYGTSWLSNGVHTWPWAGPDGHVVTIVGVNNNSVEIDNPWDAGTYGSAYYGADHWVPMSVFQSVYAAYNDMAVVLS
jgi:uncharacterized protein YvpB